VPLEEGCGPSPTQKYVSARYTKKKKYTLPVGLFDYEVWSLILKEESNMH
jgi:hypothetical protein